MIAQRSFGAIAVVASTSVAAYALDAPTITPGRGTYSTQQTVTMSAPAGTIYFTLDGTPASTSSTEYTTALAITKPTEINAVAYQSGVYSNPTRVFLDVDPNNAPLLPLGDNVTTPALHLRSDFGPITGSGTPASVLEWTDLSSLTFQPSWVKSISGNPPIMASAGAGRPAVRFTGNSNLSISNERFDFFTGAAYFIVTKPDTLTAGSRIIDFATAAGTDNILVRISDSGSLGMYSTYIGTSPTSVTSAGPLSSGIYQLLEAVHAPSPGTPPYLSAATFSVNSITGTTQNLEGPNHVLRNLSFLGQASTGGHHYSGDILEIVMYSGQINGNTSLTVGQRSAIEAFLLQRYQILSQVPADPIISVPSGTLLQPTQVVITMEPGAVTFITTDGTTPDSNSTPYLGTPLQIEFTQTVKAISIKNGVSSGVATAAYTLDANQFPAPSPSDLSAPTINVDLPTPSL